MCVERENAILTLGSERGGCYLLISLRIKERGLGLNRRAGPVFVQGPLHLAFILHVRHSSSPVPNLGVVGPLRSSMSLSYHWDSWDLDIAEANAHQEQRLSNVDGSQATVVEANKGKGKGNVDGSQATGIETNKGKEKGNVDGSQANAAEPNKGMGKNKGWQGPYQDCLGREYWTWRSFRHDGRTRTHRFFVSDS